MKKTILMVCLFMFLTVSIPAYAQPPHSYANHQCPNVAELVQTSSTHEQELLNALRPIVPKLYPDEEHNEWKVEYVQLLPNIKQTYFQMAKTFCSEAVAERSWIVRLRFPKLLPSASLSEGVIFLAKHKEKGWIVWYRYK
jgi:hypothetical protein